jgi:ParB family chromosome partitioning protein
MIRESIPVSACIASPLALRGVHEDTEAFKGLVDSILAKGFLGAITAREKKTPGDDGKVAVVYEIIDGLQRFTACKRASEIDPSKGVLNLDVQDMADADVLEAQIMMNVHKIETKPVEYTKQLQRILALHPLMTEAELARKLCKSTTWIQQRLSLQKISSKEIQDLIDTGKIPLINAYSLAALPPEDQALMTDLAVTEDPKAFSEAVQKRVAEIRAAKRQGKDAEANKWAPIAFQQTLATIKAEYADGKVCEDLCARHKPATPQEGFKLAIAWMLHLDPDGIAAQEAKQAEREKKMNEKKAQRELEKAGKDKDRAAKLAEEAATARAKAEAALKGLGIPVGE